MTDATVSAVKGLIPVGLAVGIAASIMPKPRKRFIKKRSKRLAKWDKPSRKKIKYL